MAVKHLITLGVGQGGDVNFLITNGIGISDTFSTATAGRTTDVQAFDRSIDVDADGRAIDVLPMDRSVEAKG